MSATASSVKDPCWAGRRFIEGKTNERGYASMHAYILVYGVDYHKYIRELKMGCAVSKQILDARLMTSICKTLFTFLLYIHILPIYIFF